MSESGDDFRALREERRRAKREREECPKCGSQNTLATASDFFGVASRIHCFACRVEWTATPEGWE